VSSIVDFKSIHYDFKSIAENSPPKNFLGILVDLMGGKFVENCAI
jgi:hypothetical protein